MTRRYAGFAIFMTGDKNIIHQQVLRRRALTVVVLSETHWPTLRRNAGTIIEALTGAGEGAYIEASLPRPPLRRRRAPTLG